MLDAIFVGGEKYSKKRQNFLQKAVEGWAQDIHTQKLLLPYLPQEFIQNHSPFPDWSPP